MIRIARLSQLTAAALASLSATAMSPAAAHPHIFVNGGVDFVLDDQDRLDALKITWIFDAFESLYLLSAVGQIPAANGALDPVARDVLIGEFALLLEEFSGSAHLTAGAAPVALGEASDLDVDLVNGRVQLTFQRRPDSPLEILSQDLEVGFYEATYFYDFSATTEPQVFGGTPDCRAETILFNPDTQLVALQSTLSDLSREETPAIENVGALFADRIVLKCD
ncbi:MAG: DUF1007 family protein [Pseudomonadota bacterium]